MSFRSDPSSQLEDPFGFPLSYVSSSVVSSHVWYSELKESLDGVDYDESESESMSFFVTIALKQGASIALFSNSSSFSYLSSDSSSKGGVAIRGW